MILCTIPLLGLKEFEKRIVCVAYVVRLVEIDEHNVANSSDHGLAFIISL